MLKKMRWRFIVAAMIAFCAVVLILLCAINIWNYNITVEQQDYMLERLLESQPRKNDSMLGKEPFAHSPKVTFSPEIQYMLRYFIVLLDNDGNIIAVDKEHVATVSLEDTKLYTMQVLSMKKNSGYYRGYRFIVRHSELGCKIIFLNSERELQTIRNMLKVSAGVAGLSLLVAFILVYLFSKRAIAPYVKNIEMQKRFITDAGHELKTPLTSIAASADLLAAEYTGNEWVNNIQNQTGRMAKLVSQLVTLSRLDEEQPFPEMEEFSLSEAAWEISESISAYAEAKGKTFSQRIDDGIMLKGDRSSIQQMISILLDNALKYSDEEGEIYLSVSERHKKAEIEVYNTCGNTKDIDVSRLFERFYRSDDSRTGGDSFGIGLSIARAIVEKHRGSIEAKKDGNNAICFKVVL